MLRFTALAALALCAGFEHLEAASLDMGSDQRMQIEILQEVNAYRKAHWLPPLSLNPALSEQARGHSADMANHRLPFGHDGFAQRIDAAHQAIPNSQAAGAENVAYNYKTAKIVVDGWVHSPGHRQNILGHYALTGIGIVRDASGKPYFTQLFLRA